MMAKTSHLRIDDKEVRETFQQLSTFESKAALREFKQYMRVQTDQMWDVLSNAGGSGVYRGESWPGFAPQYTRKTDGVTVPAWGGVPKVLGQGQVQGTDAGGHFGDQVMLGVEQQDAELFLFAVAQMGQP